MSQTPSKATTLGIACLIGFAYSANYTNHAPLKDLLMEAFQTPSFEFTKARFGLLTTAIFLTHACMQIPGGALADKFGPRKTLMAALCVVALGNFGITTAASYEALLAWKFLVGFGTGTCFVAGARYIYQNTPADKLLLFQGIYGASILLGSGFVLFAVPLIAQHFGGWTYGFMATAILASLAFVVACFAPQAPAKAHPHTALKQLLTHKPLYALGWVQMASFGMVIVVGTWITALLKEHPLFESHWATHALASTVLLLGIASRPMGGRLVARWGVKKILSVSLLLNSTGCLLLALFPQTLPLMALALLCLGMGCGWPYAALFHRATTLFPGRAGAAMGLVNMMGIVFILIGSPLVGQLTDYTGSFSAAFVALGLFSLTAFIPALTIPETENPS